MKVVAPVKRKFLAVYEYGMGGVWVCLLARTGQEIRDRYPDLTVLEEKPDWMSVEMANDIEAEGVYDVDAAPDGYLRNLTDARSKP